MSAAKKIIASTSGVGGAGENVEDVFATHIYTGTGSNQTITNNIDLSGEGGLVWFKRRNGSHEHGLYDTVRGTGKRLMAEQDGAQETDNAGLNSFYSNGFRVNSADDCNGNNDTYVSWTFRKAEKFFDIVTYSSAGTGNSKTVSHNLGQAPGMILFKEIDGSQEWVVWHTSQSSKFANLSYTSAFTSATVVSSASSTEFVLASDRTPTNAGGSVGARTYIAYLFANNSDDGGYGPDADLDIIKCGSFATAGSGSSLVGPNLGWEPQFVILKNATSNSNGSWWIFDSQRGFYSAGYDSNSGKTHYLRADVADQEGNFNTNTLNVTSTGFTMPSDAFSPGQTFIYMAIRRGPMAEPTAGTQVFSPISYTSSDGTWSSSRTLESNFPTDLAIIGYRDAADGGTGRFVDRTRGYALMLSAHNTNAEQHNANAFEDWRQTGTRVTTDEYSKYNAGNGNDYYIFQFRRAPGFFDIVSYIGNGGTDQTITHNLRAIPQLIIGKRRDAGSTDWPVYYGSGLYNVFLSSDTNRTGLGAMHKVGADFNDIDSTTEFAVSVQSGGNASKSLNTSDAEYVLYIFGTLAGISKVGIYTGTTNDLNVDCGFSSGARFVMVKAVESSGTDWYVWNSATGIVSGNDPYVLFNKTDAAVTNTDKIDPINSGFTITSSAGSALNANGETYLFLAIA